MFSGCLFFLSRLCHLLKLSYSLAEINIIQNPRQLLSNPVDAFTDVAGKHVLTSTLCNSTDDAAHLLGRVFPLPADEPRLFVDDAVWDNAGELLLHFGGDVREIRSQGTVVTKHWKQAWRSLAPTFSI